MIIFRSLRTNLLSQGFGKENTFPALLVSYQKYGLLGHNGWDWSAQDKEPIYWDTDGRGTVIKTSIDSSGGLGIVIASEDNGKHYKHRFWHLKEFKCQTGQIVESGELLGWANNTGFSTGTHLHRDLKECDKDGKTLNKDNGYGGCISPELYFKNVFILNYLDALRTQISILKRMLEIIKKIISLRLEIKFKNDKNL